MNEDDRAEIGKGHEFPTQLFKSHYNMPTFEISKYASSEFLAWVMAFSLGNVTVAGSAAPYTYTIVPALGATNPTREFPRLCRGGSRSLTVPGIRGSRGRVCLPERERLASSRTEFPTAVQLRARARVLGDCDQAPLRGQQSKSPRLCRGMLTPTGLELPYFSFVQQIRPGGSAVLDEVLVGCAVKGWKLAIKNSPGRASATLPRSA